MHELEIFIHIVLHLMLDLGRALLVPLGLFALLVWSGCSEEDCDDYSGWPDPS